MEQYWVKNFSFAQINIKGYFYTNWNMSRPVTREGEAPLEKCSTPWKNVLDIF